MIDFEDVLDEYKKKTKPMCEALGCLDLLDDFLVDIELSRAKYHYFYQAGQQSQQAKIDELQKQVITQGQNFNDQAQKIKDAEYFNQKLQARVDEVIKYIEPSDELSHKAYRDLIKILKGNKNEN